MLSHEVLESSLLELPEDLEQALATHREAVTALLEAKVLFERKAAECRSIIRTSGEKKPPEAAVEDHVRLIPDVILLERDVRAAQERVERASAAVEVARARLSVMRLIVQLHVAPQGRE